MMTVYRYGFSAFHSTGDSIDKVMLLELAAVLPSSALVLASPWTQISHFTQPDEHMRPSASRIVTSISILESAPLSTPASGFDESRSSSREYPVNAVKSMFTFASVGSFISSQLVLIK